MRREFVLAEIQRTARENGGEPLGRRRFESETGIKESDWYGKLWTKWSDALCDAGFTPNERQGAFDDDWLLDQFIGFVQELGRFPVSADLRIKARSDNAFPSHNTFRRFGKKAQLAARVVERCYERGDCLGVVEICQPVAALATPEPEVVELEEADDFGSVYLLKSGRHYKIGRTNSVGRRTRELAIQLPEKVQTVHVIRTDDPAGIETYWHRRFADKRKNGEWFELSASDVKAFKRRAFGWPCVGGVRAAGGVGGRDQRARRAGPNAPPSR